MTPAESLLAEAVAAINGGDYKTAAARFERAGKLLVGKSNKRSPARTRDAAAAFESAARCYLMLGDTEQALDAVKKARKLQPQSARVARVNAEVADRIGYVPTRRRAWQEVLATGAADQQLFAHLKLANIAREIDEHALAAKHFASALAALQPSDEPTLRPELHLEIAIAHTSAGEFALAEAALAQADQHTNDPGMRARITGQRGALALARGDDQTALRLAESARAQAVERHDVMTYLGAAQLIATIHERANRLIDAYDTYIRTRESLADLLGDAGRELAQPAITLFEERLGPEKFREVWDAWVARRRAAVPATQ
jgi:tetratricopeptide (TPR) repeat protein